MIAFLAESQARIAWCALAAAAFALVCLVAFQFMGNAVFIGMQPGADTAHWGLVINIWFTVFVGASLAALLLTAAAIAARHHRAQRKHRADLCSRCGYDLTGIPEPVCPECGTRFSAQAEPT